MLDLEGCGITKGPIMYMETRTGSYTHPYIVRLPLESFLSSPLIENYKK